MWNEEVGSKSAGEPKDPLHPRKYWTWGSKESEEADRSCGWDPAVVSHEQ